MHKASAGQFIIIYILLILTSCGGKQKKGQVANRQTAIVKDTGSRINKTSKKAPAKTDTAIFCADYSEVKSYDPEQGSYRDNVQDKKNYFKGKKELSDESVKRRLFPNLDSISWNVWGGGKQK